MSKLSLVVLLAVAGPVIGSVIGTIVMPSKQAVYRYLSFAAGIMLGICLINLIPEGLRLTSPQILIIGIVFGIIIMSFIEWLIPHFHISSSHHGRSSSMEKTAFVLIIGLMIHNFPEGLAIGIGSTIDISLSIAIAIAIAIHNIPEGICSSAPYYYSNGKKWHSFLVSSATTIPTIIGFALAHYYFKNLSSDLIGLLIGVITGIMLHITLFELIPAAHLSRRNPILYLTFLVSFLFVFTLTLI